MLLPTTLVGSYPQPDWLIDRAKLSKQVPRVRAQDLWRVDPQRLDAAQDDATLLAIRDQERAGLDIITDGEQQMLALARALMLSPRILLIDEPSVGLAPVLVSRTIEKIKELKDRYALTVLMAEQNFPQALRIADRGYVIVHGQIAFEGKSADELNNNELIRKFYLGL